MRHSHRMGAAALILAVAFAHAAVVGAGEPWKAPGPVTIRVVNNAGGIMDIITRIMAQGLQDSCGQTVVVSNVVGANGAIAANELLSLDASPTEMMVTGMGLFTMVPLMNPEINAEIDNFKIVTNLIADDFLLFVNPARSGINNLEEFIEHAKKNRIVFASGRPGSTTHMLVVQLLDEAGVAPGNYEAMTSNGSPTDLLNVTNGNAIACVATMGAARQATEAGTVVPIAVFSAQPFTRMGLNVPTARSAGYDIVAQSCNMLVVKAGVDQAIVDRIHNDIQEFYKTEKFRELSTRAGYVPSHMDGAETLAAVKEFGALCRDVFAKFYAGK